MECSGKKLCSTNHQGNVDDGINCFSSWCVRAFIMLYNFCYYSNVHKQVAMTMSKKYKRFCDVDLLSHITQCVVLVSVELWLLNACTWWWIMIISLFNLPFTRDTDSLTLFFSFSAQNEDKFCQVYIYVMNFSIRVLFFWGYIVECMYLCLDISSSLCHVKSFCILQITNTCSTLFIICIMWHTKQKP